MKMRAYRQQARAASTAATRAAILDAVDALFLPQPARPMSLDAVAAEAGTTVQTVIRHFGTKSRLLEEASRRGLAKVQAGRDLVPAGDLPAVAAYLARHYEESAGMMLGMLAVEDEVPAVATITGRGRALHRAWVERVLAPLLAGRVGKERRRRLAMLIAATDILTWKVLRLEQRLARREYEQSVRELLEALQ